MAEVIGVRFKDTGKLYYFSPKGEKLNKNSYVVVETAKGVECGKVALANKQISDDMISQPLREIIREATTQDIQKLTDNKEKEKSAFSICQEKIAKHKLKMSLCNVEYTFDGGKILFYFTADSRVDFRELVKDLASIFRTRIELRQIGIRDEAKMLGGLGICGREFCCSTFLAGFEPVTIKMAKDQNLSLNPVKISGSCGKLMCCLKYEQDTYLDLIKSTPKVGAIVETQDGNGVVIDQNLLTGKLTVRLDKSKDAAPQVFCAKKVKIIKDGKNFIDPSEAAKFRNLEKN